jgi:hypothetical protein
VKAEEQETISDTFATIKDAYTTIPAIKNFVSFKCWIRICFDPDSCHCIIKDLILLQESQAAIIDQDTTILTAPNFITSDYWIAARSESKEHTYYYNMATFRTG